MNTVKDSAKQNIEFPVFPIVRMRCVNQLCSLFSIEDRFLKLNVAGSIPISRSNKMNNLRLEIS